VGVCQNFCGAGGTICGVPSFSPSTNCPNSGGCSSALITPVSGGSKVCGCPAGEVGNPRTDTQCRPETTAQSFVTVWETTSAGENITIPLEGSGTSVTRTHTHTHPPTRTHTHTHARACARGAYAYALALTPYVHKCAHNHIFTLT
jgi:hypothetical protein